MTERTPTNPPSDLDQWLKDTGQEMALNANERRLIAMLATRKLAVMACVKGMKKDGRNTFQSYDYVTDENVLHTMRGLFIDNGLAFSYSSDKVLDVRDGGGKIGNVYTILITCTLTDCNTGYSETGHCVGSGADRGDKGVYKAITSAVKYYLLKNFLVPTGDDVEYASEDNYKGGTAVSRAKAAKAPASGKKPSAADKAKAEAAEQPEETPTPDQWSLG